MERYSHRERIEMIIAGETPDRFAASFWRHFFHMEHNADGLVDAMLAFQKEYDWDFMKINPRADFHIEDWGHRSQWSHDEFKKHEKTHFPIRTIDDWAKIKPNPHTAPALAEHLNVVSRIRRKSDRELPLLMTIFNPISVAGRMLKDRNVLIEHLRSEPEKVEPALRAITDTFVEYVSELRNAGADGLFFATLQWASSDMLTWEEYQLWALPYDLEIIKAAESDALNLLHVCAGNNYLEQLSQIEDYNSPLINWDADNPTNIPLDKADDMLKPKVMVGGVDQEGWLLKSEPDEIAYKIDEIKERYGRNRLVIGPGCVVDPKTNPQNLRAIRKHL
ncbi:hypothetical protein GF377_09760 [candidate division GN15 bacterium]|nr:hypothetical protein [candidate division GN15 bacterium]